MARPIKIGLDYFPLDVDYFNDTKFVEINYYHGLKGESIIIRLLCMIYKEGYFLEYKDKTPLILAATFGNDCTIEEIKNIVNTAVNCGIFDKNIFDKYSVLTSSGIQERFFEVVKMAKRKVKIVQNFLHQNVIKKYINSEETPINSEETPINSEETPEKQELSTQIKEKEIKEKKDLKIYGNSQGELPQINKSNICTIPTNKPKKQKTKFIEPTLQEVIDYCVLKGYPTEYAEPFIAHHSNRNWLIKIGNKTGKMKSWKLALATWHSLQNKYGIKNGTYKSSPPKYEFDIERTKQDYEYLKQFERS